MKPTISVGSTLAMVILLTLVLGVPVLRAQNDPLAVVTIHHRPMVHGDEITLGDIAQVQSDDVHVKSALESLGVGRAALPGDSRRLSIGTMKLRMRQANIPESRIEIVADRDPVDVLTGYQTIETSDFASLIEAAFHSVLSVPEGATVELLVDIPAQKVPLGDVDFKFGVDNLRWGKMAIPTDLFVNGSFYKRVIVRAEAWVWQDVWVSKKNVSRNELLEASDVARMQRRLPSPAHGPGVWEPLRATRYIREGTVLTWDAVEPAPQLLKGEQVTVIARFRTVTLVLVGEALADGWVGGPVPIRNTESGNTFTGQLNHDGTITVNVM